MIHIPKSSDVSRDAHIDLLAEVRSAAARPIEESFALPPACYFDPTFFGLELESIFAREWLCMGRALDIPNPGDYITLDTPLARLMSVRQRDGSIRTLSRVCRHRGALLGVQPGGHADVFVCPYHNWTYEIDGRLRGAATMRDNRAFDPGACSLPSFRTELWEGFIFVTSNAAAPPLAARLAMVSARSKPYALEGLRTAFVIDDIWNTNWKVAFENGTETYHHMGVHRQTLQPFFPTLGTRCEAGMAGYNLHVVPASPGFDFDRRAAQQLPATDLNPRLTRDELSQLLIVGVYPGLSIVFAGAAVTWFAYTPVDVARTHVRVGWLAPQRYFEFEDAAQAIARDRATLETILAEDKASCTAVQHGLMARDAVSGPLSPLERTIAEFVRYLAREVTQQSAAGSEADVKARQPVMDDEPDAVERAARKQ